MKSVLFLLLLSNLSFAQLEVVEVLIEHQRSMSYYEFSGREQVNFELTRRSFPGTDSVAYYLRVYPVNLSSKNESALFDAPYRDVYLLPSDLLKILSFIATATDAQQTKQKITYWHTITDGLKMGVLFTPQRDRFLLIQLFDASFTRQLSKGKDKNKELEALGNFALSAYRKWNELSKPSAQ